MRSDHTPLQVFTVRTPASEAADAPAPAQRRAKYDHTLHLASQPVSQVSAPTAAIAAPVLSAEIPPPEPTALAPVVASRPAPRASFVDRMVARIAEWLRRLWMRVQSA